MLRTLSGSPRRPRRRRPALTAGSAEPASLPLVRVTVIGPDPFPDRAAAEAWLTALRDDASALRAEAERGSNELNHLLRVHRATVADPLVHEVGIDEAVAVRVGHGRGDLVAEGQFDAACDLPATSVRAATRQERLAPQERLAAVLGGRDAVLACEELVARARRDVAAERPREAALQARIALESLLAESAPAELGPLRAELEADRASVATAATAALRGDPSGELQTAVTAAVARMTSALRRRRLLSLGS